MTDEMKIKKRILIVDDEEDIVMVLRLRIASWGYEVIPARNGEEAIRLLEENPPPDLILMDLKMPLMGGSETCRRIRADKRFAGIPLVLATSSVNAGKENYYLEIGANDYVLKPYNSEELRGKIKKFIG